MVSIRVAFCVVVLVVVAETARVPRDDKFTTKFDDIDVDEILKSDRLLNNYSKCMLDTGKCTPDGLELKKDVPDALTNDCAKCSEKQKISADKVLKHLLQNKQDVFAELEAKYDPEGTYRKKYEERLEKLKSE